MKYLFKGTILVFLLAFLGGCTSYEQIKQPPTGSDKAKVERFDFMESNWSYLNNRWIVTQTIKPEDLVHVYDMPYDQAKSEITEFVTIEHNYNWFHRFIISIYLNPIRFYVP